MISKNGEGMCGPFQPVPPLLQRKLHGKELPIAYVVVSFSSWDDYPSVQHVAEDVIHECLEDWGTVSKPEGHNQILVVPTSGG